MKLPRTIESTVGLLFHRTQFLCGTGAVAMLLAVTQAPVEAQVLSINVGSQTLPANDSSGPTLTFTVHNSSQSAVQVSGLNFNFQIGDGSTANPTIDGVDLITGTAFANNNLGQNFIGGNQHEVFWSITTSGAPPTSVNLNPGDTKIATVTFDTSGFSSGSWPLYLGATDNGPTSFFDSGANSIPVTISDGTLTVVPEPSTYAAVAGVGCLAFGFFVRRLRR